MSRLMSEEESDILFSYKKEMEVLTARCIRYLKCAHTHLSSEMNSEDDFGSIMTDWQLSRDKAEECMADINEYAGKMADMGDKMIKELDKEKEGEEMTDGTA